MIYLMLYSPEGLPDMTCGIDHGHNFPLWHNQFGSFWQINIRYIIAYTPYTCTYVWRWLLIAFYSLIKTTTTRPQCTRALIFDRYVCAWLLSSGEISFCATDVGSVVIVKSLHEPEDIQKLSGSKNEVFDETMLVVGCRNSPVHVYMTAVHTAQVQRGGGCRSHMTLWFSSAPQSLPSLWLWLLIIFIKFI